MTVQEATAWCNEQLGVTHSQPLGFFDLYYQLLAGRNPRGDGVPTSNAREAWGAAPLGFTVFPASSEELPLRGAILFTDSQVMVVDYASATTVTVWEQTADGGVQHVTHNRTDLPELGWWEWDNFDNPLALEEEVITDDPEPSTGAQPAPTSQLYIWVKHDNIWEVARRLNFRPLELLEHNGIDDPRTIQPGDTLHLPEPRLLRAEPKPQIEVLPETCPMHVVTPGGTRKWLFGRARTTADILPTGPRVKEHANVEIVAIAHVPLGETTVDFYMDQLALGDYPTSGRVAYTIGFDPADLADGSVEQPAAPEPPKESSAPPEPVTAVEPIAVAVAPATPPPAPAVPATPHPILDVLPPTHTSRFKATIHPLYEDRRAVRFRFTEQMIIHELDGRRPPVTVAQWDAFESRCAFFVGVDEYLLPTSHDDNGLWRMIPRDKAIPEAELYDTDLTLPDRRALHRLTTMDRLYWIPLAVVLGQYARLKSLFANNKRKESYEPTTNPH